MVSRRLSTAKKSQFHDVIHMGGGEEQDQRGHLTQKNCTKKIFTTQITMMV